MNDQGLVFCRGCGGRVHTSAPTCPHCGCVEPAQGQAAPGPGPGFAEAILTCMKKYATFEGRATRPEYWYFYLFTILLTIGLGMLKLGGLQGLASLALLLPSIAAATRRLHDMGRSGWNQLWGLTVIGIIPVVYWLCQPGTQGPNRYGPPAGAQAQGTQPPYPV